MIALTKTLTLERTIEMVRSHEMIRNQDWQMATTMSNVDALNARKKFGKKQPNFKYHKNINNSKSSCSRCGYAKHNGSTCPALGKVCKLCNKLNHFSSVCRSKREVNNVCYKDNGFKIRNNQYGLEDHNLGSITSVNFVSRNSEEPPWRTSLTIFGKEISFKIDTGADVNIISKLCYESLRPRPKLKKDGTRLRGIGGNINHMGYFVTETFINKVKYKIRLLCRRWCKC
ncbi:Uncharacterised protein at_DN0712 [Pycnogonum litorale]